MLSASLLVCVVKLPNKQLDDANKQRSTKDGPPEDGQTIVTETCGVFNDVFYKHF